MGSSASRKSNDRVYINIPLSNTNSNGSIGGGASGGEGQRPVDINNICPLAFHVKLTNQNVPTGTELTVDDQSIRLTHDSSVEVGKLTTKQLKTIQTCSGLGIEYHDIYVVIDKRGIHYAEFKR